MLFYIAVIVIGIYCVKRALPLAAAVALPWLAWGPNLRKVRVAAGLGNWRARRSSGPGRRAGLNLLRVSEGKGRGLGSAICAAARFLHSSDSAARDLPQVKIRPAGSGAANSHAFSLPRLAQLAHSLRKPKEPTWTLLTATLKMQGPKADRMPRKNLFAKPSLPPFLRAVFEATQSGRFQHRLAQFEQSAARILRQWHDTRAFDAAAPDCPANRPEPAHAQR